MRSPAISLLYSIAFMSLNTSFQIKVFTHFAFYFSGYTAMEFSTSYHIYVSGFIKYRLNDTKICPISGLQVFSHVAPKYPTGHTSERKKTIYM